MRTRLVVCYLSKRGMVAVVRKGGWCLFPSFFSFGSTCLMWWWLINGLAWTGLDWTGLDWLEGKGGSGWEGALMQALLSVLRLLFFLRRQIAWEGVMAWRGLGCGLYRCECYFMEQRCWVLLQVGVRSQQGRSVVVVVVTRQTNRLTVYFVVSSSIHPWF